MKRKDITSTIEMFPDTITFHSCKSKVKLIEESIEWRFVKKGNRRVRERVKSTEAIYKYIFVDDEKMSHKLGTNIPLTIMYINHLLSFGLISVK